MNILVKFIVEENLNPVYIYNNLSLSEVKNTILKDLKKLSGVYMIFNMVSGDYYRVSASIGKFYTRFCNHLIHLTGSKVLNNAVRKYVIANFSFVVLELFPEVVHKEKTKNYSIWKTFI